MARLTVIAFSLRPSARPFSGFQTAEQVKNAVMGVGQKPLTLLALFREHNEEFKKRIGVDRIKESYDSYLRSYKHLSAFVQEKRGIEDVIKVFMYCLRT